MAHINADLYENRQELQQLKEELQDIKMSVNTQQALTIDYTINLVDELVGAIEE